MAKQTFTSGQVLTAAQMTSLQQTAMLGGDASAKTSSYTLVAADAGTAISMSNASATTITVNTGLFAAGDIVTIVNLGAGVCTITAGTATVATSGSLALAQNQGGVLRFTSASAAIFFQFATPASGDIEGVTAGTGISGGGTSGTVTITNSMATEITAAGDIIVGTGSGTFDNLPIGTTGQVLTADTTVSPYKVKWAAAGGSSSGPAFRAYRSGSQSISATTATKVQFNAETFDTAGAFDSTTNYRFTPLTAGYYQFYAQVSIDATSGGYQGTFIYKNGARVATNREAAYVSGSNQVPASDLIYMNGSTDYVEVFGFMNGGSSVAIQGGSDETFFTGIWIRS
jgi:hypothetical protein